jgi:hypothetical protein
MNTFGGPDIKYITGMISILPFDKPNARRVVN